MPPSFFGHLPAIVIVIELRRLWTWPIGPGTRLPTYHEGARGPTRGSGRLPADRGSLFRRLFRPLSALYFRPI